MKLRRPLAACALALAACLGSVHAAPLSADGNWAEFIVNADLASSFGIEWIVGFDDGSPAHFSFTIANGHLGRLTVVDAGFSGDRFAVSDNGVLLGITSVPVDGDSINGTPVFDYDQALADSAFSRRVFTLTAGTHDVTGLLSTSLLNDYGPLNATSGALKLEVSPVPEPGSVAMLLTGLGLLGVVLRRRGDSN